MRPRISIRGYVRPYVGQSRVITSIQFSESSGKVPHFPPTHIHPDQTKGTHSKGESSHKISKGANMDGQKWFSKRLFLILYQLLVRTGQKNDFETFLAERVEGV